ncbi:neuropeptide Y receptor type 2-like [Diadema antillarum]|uniref:neuropeptide Y receptor type 2-like n=1 Tax=Diadema antillarum TaxID=105358 RepID=UPI003A86344E
MDVLEGNEIPIHLLVRSPSKMDQICSEEDVCDIQNNSAQAESSQYLQSERIIITIIIPLILGIGVPVNGAFIFVVARLRHMRTVTNFFLINLAVSDMCFMTVTTGDTLGRYLSSPVTFDCTGLATLGCCLVQFLQNTFFYASIFVVTAVTLEKFYCVCKPVRHRLISGKKRTVKYVAIVWVLAIAFALVLIPAHGQYVVYTIIWPKEAIYSDFPTQVGYCQSVSVVWDVVSNGIQTIPFFAVLSINVYMYVRICNVLTRRVRSSIGSIAGNERFHNIINTRSQKVKNQCVRMLVINGVVFFCLLSPFHFFALSQLIGRFVSDTYLLDAYTLRRMVWAFRVLNYINTAVNPFVYILSNARYRRAFFVAIPCLKLLCLRSRPHSPPTTLTIVESTVDKCDQASSLEAISYISRDE